MNQIDVTKQLSAISTEEDFLLKQDELIQSWIENSAGVFVVEPILRFMETHSKWDFGMPGALVHHVERFYKNGYEPLLIDSLDRKPTSHTIWMLNRVVNGQKSLKEKEFYIKIMNKAKNHILVNTEVREEIEYFLEMLSEK